MQETLEFEQEQEVQGFLCQASPSLLEVPPGSWQERQDVLGWHSLCSSTFRKQG